MIIGICTGIWYLDTSDMGIDEVVEAILDRVAQYQKA